MNNKKIEFYSPIREEAGVVMAFTKLHEQLGFPKIVSSSSRGFDISNIEYHDEYGVHRVVVEFEYWSSNFIAHNHHNLMQNDKKYIVICWEDDCNLVKMLHNNHQKDIYKLIELKDLVEIKPDIINIEELEKNYYLLNYNPTNADNYPFSAWKNSNMYRFSNNNNTHIEKGGKVLVKQGNYIIGGFDVVRFSNIKLENNSDIINLYKNLTDYPVHLFISSIDEITDSYVGNNIGHIFYENFFEVGNTNLRKTVGEILPDLNIRYSAIQKLTEEQYNKLIGIN